MTFVLPKSAVLLAGLALLSCAAYPTAVAKQRLEVVERESNPERLAARARAFLAIGDYTRAEQYLNAALENGGRESEILPALLSICVKDRRYRSAIQYAEDYLRKHPREHRLRFVVASLYVGLGEVEGARVQLERVIEQDPRHADAHYALAVLFRDQAKSYGKADEHFREYLRLDPRGQHAEEAAGSLLRSVP